MRYSVMTDGQTDRQTDKLTDGALKMVPLWFSVIASTVYVTVFALVKW